MGKLNTTQPGKKKGILLCRTHAHTLTRLRRAANVFKDKRASVPVTKTNFRCHPSKNKKALRCGLCCSRRPPPPNRSLKAKKPRIHTTHAIPKPRPPLNSRVDGAGVKRTGRLKGGGTEHTQWKTETCVQPSAKTARLRIFFQDTVDYRYYTARSHQHGSIEEIKKR